MDQHLEILLVSEESDPAWFQATQEFAARIASSDTSFWPNSKVSICIVGQLTALPPSDAIHITRVALLHVSSRNFHSQLLNIPQDIAVLMFVSGGLIPDALKKAPQLSEKALVYMEFADIRFLDPRPWLNAWYRRSFSPSSVLEITCLLSKRTIQFDGLLALKGAMENLPAVLGTNVDAHAAYDCYNLMQRIANDVFVGMWGSFTLPQGAFEFLYQSLEAFLISRDAQLLTNAKTARAMDVLHVSARLPEFLEVVSQLRHEANNHIDHHILALQLYRHEGGKFAEEDRAALLSAGLAKPSSLILMLNEAVEKLEQMRFHLTGELGKNLARAHTILDMLCEPIVHDSTDISDRIESFEEKFIAISYALRTFDDFSLFSSGLEILGQGLLGDNF